ncbi:DUF11 domain-containing protein [Clostridium sp. D53t1_180928_C8]|uniref:DUF11 domain-containing protein n=1 Tax=Clostridium sp. D53t1_180928_C8 TaxID=2787101 RepID=UPI0018AB018D|nr:DUF11 domain-containing protein [Clostridium sp. D53t1_180928_C8]
MIVVNQGRVNYCYKKSKDHAEICDTVCSNRVITIIIDYKLFIEKSVDKVISSLWDILTYTITIYNLCDNTVKNIRVFDKLPSNTLFIDNSVKINNITQYGANPENLYIGNLYSKKKVTITFRVAILKCYNEEVTKVINVGNVSYDYLYNIEEKPVQMHLITNKVVTLVNCNIFSQISTSSKTTLNSENFKKVKICEIDTKIKILNYKIINTHMGLKILIIWKMYYLINYYKYNSCYGYKFQRENRFDYFSNILDVPPGIKYIKKININVFEEDCTYSLLPRTNELTIYNTILIYLN